MKQIFLLFIFLLVSCTKQKVVTPPSQQSSDVITYKLSCKRVAPTWFFKRLMLVYQGMWTTMQDSVSSTSNTFTFTPPAGHYSYVFSYTYKNNLAVDTNKIYASDSIRMRILINGIVKKDTAVDGLHSGGTITYFY